jgi:hypothetical protein
MNETISDLLKSLKVTAGSRFNAGKRLEHHDRKLTFLTACASAYVIALTILPYFISLTKTVSDILSLVTVVFSVIILASSLLQYSSGNTVKAEQYHRSALEINELRRELKIKAETISEDAFLSLSNRYNIVLQKYSVNHDDIDYERYQLERPDQFPWIGWGRRLQMWASQQLFRNAPNAALLIITGAFLWLVFFYALPARVR